MLIDSTEHWFFYLNCCCIETQTDRAKQGPEFVCQKLVTRVKPCNWLTSALPLSLSLSLFSFSLYPPPRWSSTLKNSPRNVNLTWTLFLMWVRNTTFLLRHPAYWRLLELLLPGVVFWGKATRRRINRSQGWKKWTRCGTSQATHLELWVGGHFTWKANLANWWTFTHFRPVCRNFAEFYQI